jgi:AAA-like domain
MLNLIPEERITLMNLTGGHPYLVRIALDFLVQKEATFAQLIKNTPITEWYYGDHLRHHLDILQKSPDLLAAMERIIAVNDPVSINMTEAFNLFSMGLVKFSGNDVEPLCNLYRQYFREMLDGRR